MFLLNVILLLGMMNQRGPQAPLLDVYLAMEARRKGKTVDSLETADIYCEVSLNFI